jgi:hypothetical protein
VSQVDFAFLENYVGGDQAIAVEVLGLFLAQAQGWAAGLAAPGADFRDLAHALKGAAVGIGARTLGDAVALAETQGPAHASAVAAALDGALAEIEAYLANCAST